VATNKRKKRGKKGLSAIPIRQLCYMSVFVAIIAVSAQILIPLPHGVPMTLQTFTITMSGIMLGPKKGTLTALVYLLLGGIGIPVFAGFSGGLGIIFGFTGGFIMSFPIMAYMAGIGGGKNNRVWLACCLTLGTVFNLLVGMLWFGIITGNTLIHTFFIAVLPFLPGSVIEIVLITLVGFRMKGMMVTLINSY